MDYNGLVLGIVNNSVLVQPMNSKLPNRNHFVTGGPVHLKHKAML